MLELVSAEMPPRPLALVRIGIGLAVALKGIDWAVRLPAIALDHFGPTGLGLAIAGIAIAAWMLAAVALISGWFARPAAVVVSMLSIGFALTDIRLYNQHLYLLASLCVPLALSACDRDLVLRRAPSSQPIPRWPAVLLMSQMSLVYGLGAIAKTSMDFVSGAVLFAVFSRQPIAAVGGEWLLDASVLIPMSLAVIGCELFLAFGAWRQSLRPLVLAVAGPLHVGMVVLLAISGLEVVRLMVFGALQLIVLLVLFAPAPTAERVVVWDDSCGFCAAWTRMFRRLDWLGAIRLVPLSDPAQYEHLGITQIDAAHALQLRMPDGSRHGGYEAVRRIAYLLPLTMLLAPWLALPPVRVVGDRVYRRIAERRTCSLPAPVGANA
ncbi:MAG TPA: DCC1-like thiol-disulfide oxidoreductase family protein [Candidatus Limnocylindria bacterium]|nr:DCC1-like thiol-disulfide oxidoreductase family protein [Candidatus Limnocylindria bacterium]